MMPKCLSLKSGVHWVSVRNSQSGTTGRTRVSKTRTPTMPAVVRIETSAASSEGGLDQPLADATSERLPQIGRAGRQRVAVARRSSHRIV